MDRSGVQCGNGVWDPRWEGCEVSVQIGDLPFQFRAGRVEAKKELGVEL